MQMKTQNTELSQLKSNDARMRLALKDAIDKGERYKTERDEVLTASQAVAELLATARRDKVELERKVANYDKLVCDVDALSNELESVKVITIIEYSAAHMIVQARFATEQRRYDETHAQQRKLIAYLQAQVASTPIGGKKSKLGAILRDLHRPASPPTRQIHSSASSTSRSSVTSSQVWPVYSSSARARHRCKKLSPPKKIDIWSS
jgi:hypothetical protein